MGVGGEYDTTSIPPGMNNILWRIQQMLDSFHSFYFNYHEIREIFLDEETIPFSGCASAVDKEAVCKKQTTFSGTASSRIVLDFVV